MNVLTEFFLKKRIFTFVLMALFLILGVEAMLRLQVETVPEVNTPVIYAAVPLPGAAPEEIESLITNPIEEKLGEMDDVDRISSSSYQNVAIIIVFFKEDVKSEEKFKEFREKINEARAELPAEAMAPIIEEISFENLPMMFIGFRGNAQDQALSSRATMIKKQLEGLSGVKRVVMNGATDKRVEIRLRAAALQTYGPQPVKLLLERLGEINTNMPGGMVSGKDITAAGGGVYGYESNKEYNVRVVGKFDALDDLRNMVVGTHLGYPVALRDMGTVNETYPPPTTVVHVDGKPGVTLAIMKKRGHGTIEVAKSIKQTLKQYPDIVVLSDASETVKNQMGELQRHALWGVGLVMLVLLLALGFRVAAIVSFALPMSILITFAAMGFKGMTLDMVSLFALLLALGMIVDNSIVVCENIFRHMTLGKSPQQAALEGTNEVTLPILTSTGAVVAAFLPMGLFLTGPIGEFTRPIPIVVTFSLLASLVVANFFNPLLCGAFIKNVKVEDENDMRGVWHRVKHGYKRLISWCLDHGGIVMVVALLLLVACLSLVALKVVGLQLFPQLDTAKFYIDVKTPAGSSLQDTTNAVKKIENVFDNSKYVGNYITNLGTSGTRIEIDDRVFFGSNVARFIVDLKPRNEIDKSHKQVVADFRKQIQGLFKDGTDAVFIEKMLGPPVGAPISIELAGQNIEQLKTSTHAVRKMLAAEKGVVDIKDDLPADVPQIIVKPDQAALASVGATATCDAGTLCAALASRGSIGNFGMTTREFGGLIFFTLTGYNIGKVVLNDEKRDLFLKIDAGGANFLQQGINLPNGQRLGFLDLLKDKEIPRPSTGLSAVEHENSVRTVTVEANLAKGYEAQRIIDHIKKYLPQLRTDLAAEDPETKNVSISFAGETMLLGQAFNDLLKAIFISLAFIYLILLLEFRSTLQPLIILVCVPYALVGVIIGLLIMHYPFSILAGIGLLCLIGIVVNNGIIYIDYANMLQNNGMPRREACLQACLTRLRPIVLTKATVILGIMPIAAASASKTQFWKPLCWAIIWGLLIATTLTLVIIPVAYYITEGWRNRYYKNKPSIAPTDRLL